MTQVADDSRAAAEPWMRNTHCELDPLRRGVVHALELAIEDVDRWVTGLQEEDIEVRPDGLPSVAFHLRHMARSLDRLLTYAEGRPLSEEQLGLLTSEQQSSPRGKALQEFRDGIADALSRIRQFAVVDLVESRGIGRKQLPTTVGGLLVHCAEHTQRHSGQMVTTAKLLRIQANSCADQPRQELS